MVLRAGGAVKKGAEYRSKKRKRTRLGPNRPKPGAFWYWRGESCAGTDGAGRGEAASGHYLRHGVPMLDKNDVSIDPAALDLRQGVEGVPEPDKQLHALQKLLGRGLMQAGGVFDPILTVQGILRLVPGEPPLVSRFIADAGPERLGLFLGNLDKLILDIPIIKIFQIDGSHYKPPFRCWVNE